MDPRPPYYEPEICPRCNMALIATLHVCKCPGAPHPFAIIQRCPGCGFYGADPDHVFVPPPKFDYDKLPMMRN